MSRPDGEPTSSSPAAGPKEKTLTSSVRRLKIAVWHHLPSGGGRRALAEQIKGLVNRGHHVEVWTPARRSTDLIDLTHVVPEHVIPLERRRPHGKILELVHLLQGVRADIEVMDRHCRECARQIHSGGFDILFGNTSQDFAVTSIARASALPSALYLQEPLRELYEALPSLPWVAGPPVVGLRALLPGHMLRTARALARIRKLGILAREERVNAAAFDIVLVNSAFSRESVRRAYGLSAHVCPLGVDVNLFRPLGLERQHVIVGLGALVRPKRPDLLIEVVRLLPEPRPRIEWIANSVDPEFRREVTARAVEVGVDFRLHIGIPDREVVRLLNTACLMVYAPILEPFGFAPLEAGACALPVVAVGEGGVRETVIDGVNGLVVRDHPQALADAIVCVLTDPQLRRRLGEGGRRCVETRWSLDRATSSLENFLVDITDRTRSAR